MVVGVPSNVIAPVPPVGVLSVTEPLSPKQAGWFGVAVKLIAEGAALMVTVCFVVQPLASVAV